MATKSTKTHKIGWLNVPGYIPQTWNPIVGCSKISEGCRNCYAERQAIRNYNCLTADRVKTTETYFAYQNALQLDENPAVQKTFGFNQARWSGFTFLIEETLHKPLGWKKPSAIFVNSMGDMFHENTPDEWIDRVFAVMALCPQHLFIVLTKRAEKMEKYFSGWRGEVSPQNMWLGVTAENQAAADERIPHLLRTPAAIRFVSCEPMIGPVNVHSASLIDYDYSLLPGNDSRPVITWVICGGESGPGARSMNPEWARSLRYQCAEAGVPFFFKQWGSCGDGTKVQRDKGKKGGDIIDGKQHHQWPGIINGK